VLADIAAGRATPVAFEVDCPLTGARIKVSTTGQNPDPDGYRVVVDGSDRGAIPANGTMLTRLDPGRRTISLAGLASNCAIEGSAAHTVTIVTAEVATTDFVVVCTAPPLKGSIAFESSGDIYVMDADGSNPVNLTKTGRRGNFDPAWSPDRTRIAFASDRDHDAGVYDIFVMNADGSNPVNLTLMDGENRSRREPAWSPDGTRIAFTYRGGIYVMNADGSNVADLSNVILSNISEYIFAPWFRELDWSPDGTRIAFSLSDDICCADIYVVNADGSAPRNLTPRSRGIDDRSPAWSPDGMRIAHSRRVAPGGAADIYVMSTGGSAVVNLSNNTASDLAPAWSPDGTHIAFVSDRDDTDFDIYVMGADGTDLIRLTARTGSDRSPAWAP
jgi:TolB protein